MDLIENWNDVLLWEYLSDHPVYKIEKNLKRKEETLSPKKILNFMRIVANDGSYCKFNHNCSICKYSTVCMNYQGYEETYHQYRLGKLLILALLKKLGYEEVAKLWNSIPVPRD